MLEKIVAFCLRWPWAIVLLTLALSGAGGYLTVEKFAIDTDTVNLFSSSLPGGRTRISSIKLFQKPSI